MTVPIPVEQLRALINAVPRVSLGHKPTPLEEMPRLSKELGVRILVKRDDMTGLALGGNKVRNLEFRLAEAIATGADTIIMSVDILSNSARQTTAAATQLGLKTVLVLRGEKPQLVTGNLLVDYVLGAEIIFARDETEQTRAVTEAKDRWQRNGHTPYVLKDSPMFVISAALAYADATLELLDQLKELDVDLGRLHLYISSTGKGQPGLELAVRALGLPIKVTGVAATYSDNTAKSMVANNTYEAAKYLGLKIEVQPEEIDNRDDYIGPGYGLPSPEGQEAIMMAARTSGLILDPVYTGKAFAAIIDDSRTGRLSQEDVIIFFHTGGLPLMFSLADQFASIIG